MKYAKTTSIALGTTRRKRGNQRGYTQMASLMSSTVSMFLLILPVVECPFTDLCGNHAVGHARALEQAKKR